MSSEEQLLVQLRRRVPRAFEVLVREHSGKMRAMALRLLRNESDADDAVQDAFVAALGSLGSFDGRSKLSTWLHRITLNACLMKLRVKGAQKETELTELLPKFNQNGVFEEPQSMNHPGPEMQDSKAELCLQVRAHIEDLPNNYRVPLLLRHLEEMSFFEIGKAMEISENAAKLRVHRARQALRSLLEPKLEGWA